MTISYCRDELFWTKWEMIIVIEIMPACQIQMSALTKYDITLFPYKEQHPNE